jgi:hypothetical protein
VAKIIYKYLLPIQDKVQMILPEGFKILHIGVQDGSPHLWVLQDPDCGVPKVSLHLRIYGTGEPLPNNPGLFLKTVQISPFVWHVFQVGEN